MNIVQCPQCGAYIHQAELCFHCGAHILLPDNPVPAIHENAIENYLRMDRFLQAKKFSQVIILSFDVLQWEPEFSDAFRLRLLARHEKTSVLELLSEGFSCESDADYLNALKFSSGAERTAYEDLGTAVRAVRENLIRVLNQSEHQSKMETDVIQIRRDAAAEIEDRKRKVFGLWSEMQQTEQAMLTLEADMRLSAKEYAMDLQASKKRADSICQEVRQLSECAEERRRRIQVRLSGIMGLLEQAQKSAAQLKDGPLVRQYSSLKERRDQLSQQIAEELDDLKAYKPYLEETIQKITEIETRYSQARRETETYRFSSAAALLGSYAYRRILSDSGIKAYQF